MVKKLTMVLAGVLMSMGVAFAQMEISGVVIAQEDQSPVIGAAVKVVGTNIGTITNMDGQFKLTCPSGKHTLRISYIGMVPKEVMARKNMRIELESEDKQLDEVVVVAYGTQKKTTLTGSIQEVKSEAIEVRPVSSVASALEGTVSGIQVNSSYGVPGSDPSIRIRGVGTVNGDTSPLYVIDGVPFGGNISDLNPADIESMSVLKDAASAALYGNRASNGVILITTKKGKQGRLNISLDIKQGTYSRGIPEYDLLDARDWMEMEWLNMKNYRMSAGDDAATAADYASKNLITDRLYLNIFNKADDALFTTDGKLVSDAQMKGTYAEDLDWYDATIRNGYRQEYNFSANGANEKADYLLSLGYLDENGYIQNAGFDRISARVSANIRPKKWFRAGINLSATHQNYESTYGTGSSGYTNVFMYCRNISPIYPIHLHDINTGEYILDANGNKQYDGGSYTDADGVTQLTRNQYADRHVIWENEVNEDKTVRNTINGTAYADFILPYNFTFTLKGNLNVRNSTENAYNSAEIGDGKGNNGRGNREEYRYKNYTFQQQLHWAKEFGVHSIDALIGHENYKYTYNYLYGYKTNQVFEGKNNLRNFTDITNLYDYNSNYRTESYLGRVRYGYSDRYNAEISFRRDGSSRFAKESRWGNFWSIGANWVISSEEFMKKVEWVNFLKLRADYGEVGNDAGSGYYGYMSLYSSTQNANEGAYWISQLPNEDLRWETGQSWGIGVDARLFKRWNISMEYFDKRNKDLLFDVYQPLSAGATSTSSAESVITQNIGTIANRGFEISTDVDVYRNKDWKVNFVANATFLKNKVLKLPEQNKDGIVDGTKKIMEGKDRYAFYVYTWEGINTANGYSLYKFNDEDYFFTLDGTTYGNEEGTEITGTNLDAVVVIDGTPYSYITSYGKKEFHGSAMPKVYGSFGLNVTWKSLTFSTLFTYQLGGKIMDTVYSGLLSTSGSPSALHKDVQNSWRYENRTEENAIDPNGTPVLNNNPVINGGSISANLNSTSSRFLTSASYLVLKNINIAYQLPKAWVHKIDLESVTLSATCENLFTKTARKGMNPQYSFAGTQSNAFTTPRVFTVGLNVKF